MLKFRGNPPHNFLSYPANKQTNKQTNKRRENSTPPMVAAVILFRNGCRRRRRNAADSLALERTKSAIAILNVELSS